MTDVNYLQTFALPSVYDQQMLEAKRRQQYADMLQQQASQSLIPQQGRIASKINPLAGVAQMLAAGLGGYERRQAENAQLAANQADVQNAMSFMDKLQAGKRPDFTPDQALAASLSSEPTPTPQNVPFSPQERQQMLIRQSMTGGPRSQAIAQMLMAQKQPTAMDFVNKIDAEKFTPASVAAFGQTAMAGAPDFSKLQLKPEKAAEVPSAIKEYEYAVGQGYKGSYQQFVIDQKRAGATNVNVPVNTEKTYAGAVAGKLAEADSAAIDAARNAPAQIQSSMRIKSLLAQNPITGTGANARLSLDKALSNAGIIDPSRSITTENLVSELAGSTLNSIRTSGLGAGQGFTDKDREFLEKAKSGNIEINSQSLAYLADLNERTARTNIERGNKVISRLRKSPNFGPEFGLENVEAPAMGGALPQGFVIQQPARR